MLTTPTSKYENEQNAKIPCKVSPTPAIELREIPSTWKSAPGSFCPISIHTTFKKKNLQRNKNILDLWSHQKSSFWNYASFYFARKRHRFRSSNVLTVLNRLGIAVNKVTWYWSASKCSSIPTAAIHFWSSLLSLAYSKQLMLPSMATP